MRIFEGEAPDQTQRNDEKGKAFDGDVLMDTPAGFRILASAGEKLGAEYYDALKAGSKKIQPPTENKSATPAVENKAKK